MQFKEKTDFCSGTRRSGMISIPVSMTLEVSDTSGQVVQRTVGEQAQDSVAAAAE